MRPHWFSTSNSQRCYTPEKARGPSRNISWNFILISQNYIRSYIRCFNNCQLEARTRSPIRFVPMITATPVSFLIKKTIKPQLLGTGQSRKIPATLILYSLSKPYLDSTL